jgi:DNA-binding YbaB/EbfC family protein
MFNKGQIAGLMKQAQAMQENLKKAQEEIAAMEVEGQAGAGLVKVRMSGKHQVLRISIDPSVMGDDHEMVEDMVAAAVNDAVRQIDAESETRMAKVSGGMPGMPPGMKLPF